MSYKRSCQSISAKCSIVPLVNNFMQIRKESNGSKLGKLGSCVFQPLDDFFKTVLNEKKRTEYIKTPVNIVKDQVVVGMGDIHGDLLVFLSVLYLMGVIDLGYNKKTQKWYGGNWIGGNTIVVQCGDLLDRSGRSASVMTDNVREEVDLVQYMHYLNKSAQKYGGGVYWVLGNHDIARVWWKSYRGAELEVEDPDEIMRRRKVSPDYRKYIGNQVIGWGGNDKMEKLFHPGGDMAVYMSRHTSVTLQVGYYVFMHGGLTIDLVNKIYDGLNVVDSKYFFGMVNMNISNSFKNGIPMNKYVKKMAWDRTWSFEKSLEKGEKWKDNKTAITTGRGSTKAGKYCIANMKGIFQAVGMDWEKGAFVLGHSIQKEGIPLYCKGRVWRIDVGMSEAFSSGKMPKMIGGIKVFQHPESSDIPVEVLIVMNYSTTDGRKYIDKFNLYVHRKFRRVVTNPENMGKDETKITAYWKRNIIDEEIKLQKKRISTGVRKFSEI
jgi:hypothetical protein